MTVWLRFPFSCWLLTEALVAQTVKTLPPRQKTWVQSLGWEDLLEKKIHFRNFAWRIHRQRRLVGYSSWGHKELVTTEWLSLHFTLQPTVPCYIAPSLGRPCGRLLLQSLQESDFPGGPVAKTLHSQCRGPRFDPLSGN